MNDITVKKAANEIARHIQEGINSWMSAGAALVELLEGGHTMEEIHAQIPQVPISALYGFEKIGRKKILPELLIADYAAAHRLGTFSYDQQVSLMDKGVQVLLLSSIGTDKLHCNVRDLTADQCRQVFDKDGVRSLSQQRAWLEGEAARRNMVALSAKTAVEPYEVKGRRLVVRGPVEFTARQLAMFLAQIEN